MKDPAVHETVVSSAVPLGKDQLDAIKLKLKHLVSSESPMRNRIDKKLIGGFTIQIGDWFLDASIKRELSEIKRALLA